MDNSRTLGGVCDNSADLEEGDSRRRSKPTGFTMINLDRHQAFLTANKPGDLKQENKAPLINFGIVQSCPKAQSYLDIQTLVFRLSVTTPYYPFVLKS